MTDSLVNLLRKTFIDGDPKNQVASTQDTTLRSSVASNTVFEHTCKWLTEEELETQCIDWVFHYLLSKNFPESSAIRVTLEVRDCIFLDHESMAKLKGSQEDGVKRIPTEKFENHVLAALTKIATIWYKNFQLVQDPTESSSAKSTDGFSVHAVKNTRRKMEDKHVTMPYFSELFKLKGTYSFYAVFDGHGGVEAAKYSSTHLPGLLGRYLRDVESQIANTPTRNSKVVTLMPPEAVPEPRRAPSPDVNPSRKSGCRLLIPSLSGNQVMRRSSESLTSPDPTESPNVATQRKSYHGSESRSADVLTETQQPSLVSAAVPRGNESDVKKVEKVLEKSFLETDRMFCERVKHDSNGSGCTALCLLIEEGRRFYLSWAGDSQAVLVRDGKAVEIMKPHKPEREDERARIEALGGSVVHFGTWRVNGAISVSRAIGDTGYKPYITSQPDTSTFATQSDDEYVVLACDGLWDVLSYDDVIRLVTDHVTVKKKEKKTVAQMLVKAAIDHGSNDNITILIVFLGKDLPTISVESSSSSDEKSPDENSDNGSSSENRDDKMQDSDNAPGSSKRTKTSHCSSGHVNSRTQTSALSLSRKMEFDLPEKILESENAAFQTASSSTVEAGNDVVLQPSQRHEASPKAPSELTGNSSSTNDDSKRNYFASSAELTLDLEFSPLRSGPHDTGSAASLRSRVKRSPKISSSMESKEDKENIGLSLSPRFKPALTESTLRQKSSDALEDSKLWEKKSATDSSKMKLKETNALIKEQSQNHVRTSKGFLSKAASPEEKDVRLLLFQVPPSNREQNQLRQPQQRSTTGNFYSSQKQLQVRPKKIPFVSTSAVSVGLLKEGGRKFSHTGSHLLRKLDVAKSRSIVGSSNSVNDSVASGRSGVREKWTIAVETGEDLEDMFETAEQDSANLNVSSTRW